MNQEEPPRRLRDELIGQDPILDRIEHALREDRLGHAYLLLGPKGSGRTRTALAIAQLLLCSEADSARPQVGSTVAQEVGRTAGSAAGSAISRAIPCGICSGCRKAAALTHSDLHLIFPAAREEAEDPERMGKVLEAYAAGRLQRLGSSGNATIGIDRLRRLKEEVAKAVVEGTRRVVILSSADCMTEQAAQSTLKLVEEPPENTTLLLTAEEQAQLLPTLISRCQKMHVRLLPREAMMRLLIGDLETDEAEAAVLASLSGGSLGRALELKETDALALRDRIIRTFDLPSPGEGVRIAPDEIERRVQKIERIWTPETAERAGNLLLVWLRDLLAARCGLEKDSIANVDHAEEALRAGRLLSVEEIRRRIRLVEEMVQAVDQYVNPALALHATLSRIAAGQSPEDATF
jgi:DNA polymerase III subunit delta'